MLGEQQFQCVVGPASSSMKTTGKQAQLNDARVLQQRLAGLEGRVRISSSAQTTISRAVDTDTIDISKLVGKHIHRTASKHDAHSGQIK
jgi:hypothetical protein